MKSSGKTTFLAKLRGWARQIKKEIRVLQIALTEKSVPWYAKAIIILTIGYALSPIDLIPDFIPVLGLLDDLIILPLLIWIALKLIHKDTMQLCRQKAEKQKIESKKNWVAGGIIIIIWLMVLAWVTMILV